MKTTPFLLAVLLAASLSAQADEKPEDLIARGRHLAVTTGCTDCHTAGYARAAGNLPESQWFLGSPLGFAGSWGTTYPSNLRLYMQNLSADAWVAKARTFTARPPMPWFALRQWDEGDLRALYAFVRSLGPGGQPAPAYLPPGQVADGPVVSYPK